jgi:antitoxin Phd
MIDQAASNGPQAIALDGKEIAVLFSIAEWQTLTSNKPDLRAYLLGGPKVDDFEIARDQASGPEITF